MTKSSRISRRDALTLASAATLPWAQIRTAKAVDASPAPAPVANQPAILFVHGSGGSATAWFTTVWRFESNGYDSRRLFALSFTNPTWAFPQHYGKLHPGRSTWAESLIEFVPKVDEVKRITGQEKIVLVGHSRGGLVIRNYIKNTSGLGNISMAILCATSCHGAFASDAPEWMLAENNGWGYFLRQLNAGPVEATEDVRFLTIRSDKNDAGFQPVMPANWPQSGGRSGVPSNIGYDSPALTGATNVTLAGLDHFECAKHPLAFREMYRFITGEEPKRLDVVPENSPILNGMVTGRVAGLPTNLPVAGAGVEIFEVSPTTGERLGEAVHRRTTETDGWWGPFTATSKGYYEIVLAAPGYSIRHTYIAPVSRSTSLLHLRMYDVNSDDRNAAGSVVWLIRLGGNLTRDTVLIDGRVPPDINDGPPDANDAKLRVDTHEVRSARLVCNDQQLSVRTWPAQDNHVVTALFYY